ncbi:MAG: hypothetical protein KF878_09845 [Planctomycetes bacterium]|nr:hypothetical protein [Planctomycetota bacterium]
MLGAELPEDQDQALAVLLDAATHFLMGGGVLSLQDWAAMDTRDRAVFVRAGRKVRAWQAAQTGLAAQGHLHALKVMADVDGGQAHDDAVMTAALARALQKPTEVVHGRPV